MAGVDRSAAIESIGRAPLALALGLTIESAAGGAAVARMRFASTILNDGGPDAPIHGGAIAALADFAACAAVWSLAETERSATISMTINYAAPAVKTDLIARATVRRQGKRVASLTVEVGNEAGELIADALVTYKIA